MIEIVQMTTATMPQARAVIVQRCHKAWGNIRRHVDHEHRGPWATCREAWLSITASHGFVCQDDFMPLLSMLPELDVPVSVFQPCGRPEDVREFVKRCPEWIPPGWFPWGGSLILPHRLIAPVIELADTFDMCGTADDERIGLALQAIGEPVWCLGSLMRHEGYSVSLVGNDASEWRLGAP